MGFLGSAMVKNLPANAGDAGSITGLGRSLGVGNLLQYSCLENPMHRAWWARPGFNEDLLSISYREQTNSSIKFFVNRKQNYNLVSVYI